MTDVFFISNTRLYRDSLAEMLARDGRLRIAGTADSAGAALDFLAGGARCVVLLDMAIPESLAAARALAACSLQVKVVAFGISETRGDVLSCAQAGVSGYVCRQGSLDELVAAVVSAERGELICSPRIAAALMDSLARSSSTLPENAAEVQLTERELEIAGLLDQGLGNREIALRLHITVATVKVHVHHILEKLGSVRRGEAAAKLRLAGLLPSQRLRLVPSQRPASGAG